MHFTHIQALVAVVLLQSTLILALPTPHVRREFSDGVVHLVARAGRGEQQGQPSGSGLPDFRISAASMQTTSFPPAYGDTEELPDYQSRISYRPPPVSGTLAPNLAPSSNDRYSQVVPPGSPEPRSSGRYSRTHQPQLSVQTQHNSQHSGAPSSHPPTSIPYPPSSGGGPNPGGYVTSPTNTQTPVSYHPSPSTPFTSPASSQHYSSHASSPGSTNYHRDNKGRLVMSHNVRPPLSHSNYPRLDSKGQRSTTLQPDAVRQFQHDPLGSHQPSVGPSAGPSAGPSTRQRSNTLPPGTVTPYTQGRSTPGYFPPEKPTGTHNPALQVDPHQPPSIPNRDKGKGRAKASPSPPSPNAATSWVDDRVLNIGRTEDKPPTPPPAQRKGSGLLRLVTGKSKSPKKETWQMTRKEQIDAYKQKMNQAVGTISLLPWDKREAQLRVASDSYRKKYAIATHDEVESIYSALLKQVQKS